MVYTVLVVIYAVATPICTTKVFLPRRDGAGRTRSASLVRTPSKVLVRTRAKAIICRGSTSAEQDPTDVAGVVALVLVFSTLSGNDLGVSSAIAADTRTGSVNNSRIFLRRKRVRAIRALVGYVMVTSKGSTDMTVTRRVYNDRRRFIHRVGRQTRKLKVGGARFRSYYNLARSPSRCAATESVTVVDERLVAGCPGVLRCSSV